MAGQRRGRLKPKAHEPEGGSGGTPPELKNARSELRMLEMAVVQRWPLTPELKAKFVELAEKRMGSKSERISVRAMELLRHIEAQNQADQHLKARLENSGLALVEARRTFETMPDGSTREVQEVRKLYGVEAQDVIGDV